MITNTNLYVPADTLSIDNDIKCLENVKVGFKKIMTWNKYRSEITTKPKKQQLNYVNDPTFSNNNRTFVQSFKATKMILKEIILISITCHQ